MKPKLFLHIGTHKTASTVIQRALDQNRAHLRASGVLYPDTSRGRHPDLPKHDVLFTTSIHPDQQVFEAEFKAIMDEFETSQCSTMILSEEALSEPREKAFSKLRRFAEHFEIETICYLRRPDYFIESLWNQRCKEGVFKAPVGPFARDAFNLKRLEYDRILDWWSDFTTVHAINYETVKSGQILTSFFEQIGSDLRPTEETRINVSPSGAMRPASVRPQCAGAAL